MAFCAINKKKKLQNSEKCAGDKIKLRRHVLTEMGAAKANVFDLYAGVGSSYRKVWKDAFVYYGCDKIFIRDERKLYVANNERIVRCVDLYQFNIFDLDAFGSPWKVARIIATRRKLREKERIAMIITDGSRITARAGRVEAHMAILSGTSQTSKGMHNEWPKLHMTAGRSIAKEMGGIVVRGWQVCAKAMVYSAFLFERPAEPAMGCCTQQEGTAGDPS